MIKDEMLKALNAQLNKEFFSEYLYLSMSAYFSNIGLNGFANWMRVQTQEEHSHAMLIYDYIVSQNGKVELEKIEKPKTEWKDSLELFEQVLAHEEFITESINSVITVAEEQKDRATASYFLWFIDEQVQEEASAQDIISKLKLIDTDKSALYMLDKDLATRVFTPPTKTAASVAG